MALPPLACTGSLPTEPMPTPASVLPARSVHDARPPPALTRLCASLGLAPDIDWSAGVAHLRGDRRQVDLHFAPAGPCGAGSAAQCRALTRLAEGLTQLWLHIRPHGGGDPEDLVEWPPAFTMDADVLRTSQLVLARQDQATGTWRFVAIPPHELKALMQRRSPQLLRGVAAFGKPAVNATGVARPVGRYDLDVVIQAWWEVSAASAIASKRPASTRLFQMDGQGRIEEIENPHFRRSDDPPLRVRMTVVSGTHGDAHRHIGPYGIPPDDLARSLAAIAGRISPDRPVSPRHVSVVSCALDGPLYPGYGGRLHKALGQVFADAPPSVSVRTGPYAVDAQGRKFQRTGDGDFMHRKPGGTLVLSTDPSGALRQCAKDVESGQSFIAVDNPPDDPLLRWLQSTTPTRRDAALVAAKVHVDGDCDIEPYLMGEVEIERRTLRCMGASDYGGLHAGRTIGEMRAPDAMLTLKFDPRLLVAFIAGRGDVPQRIQALRLLRQLMRAGRQDRLLLTAGGPWGCGESMRQAKALLEAVRLGMDDGLHLSPAVWARCWHPEDAPPLPMRRNDVSAHDAAVAARFATPRA